MFKIRIEIKKVPKPYKIKTIYALIRFYEEDKVKLGIHHNFIYGIFKSEKKARLALAEKQKLKPVDNTYYAVILIASDF